MRCGPPLSPRILRRMRIVIANPPGFGGPDYDHHLCSALAAQGEDVELVTARFRFGSMPEPAGYRRSLAFYPTACRRQLHNPVWAESAVLHLLLLSGTDRLVNLVQWFSMAGSVVGVSLIAGQLGAGRRGQALAALFCGTLPMGIRHSPTDGSASYGPTNVNSP